MANLFTLTKMLCTSCYGRTIIKNNRQEGPSETSQHNHADPTSESPTPLNAMGDGEASGPSVTGLTVADGGIATEPRGASSGKTTAKAGVMLALELAEKALDGLPIPGVKGTIGGVLKILKDIEVSPSFQCP